jgi:hypothetical protein
MSSTIGVQNIAHTNGTVAATVSSGGVVTATSAIRAPGAVLQVKQTLKTNAFNTASTSFVDVTGLSVNITPSSTSSNILIKVSLGALSMGASPFLFRILRDTSTFGIGTDSAPYNANFGMYVNDGGAFHIGAYEILDTGVSTTSQVTYKLQAISPDGANSYINRRVASAGYSLSSTIIATEIGG